MGIGGSDVVWDGDRGGSDVVCVYCLTSSANCSDGRLCQRSSNSCTYRLNDSTVCTVVNNPQLLLLFLVLLPLPLLLLLLLLPLLLLLLFLLVLLLLKLEVIASPL